MKATYDTYYQTENLFGNPYPELIEFFAEYPQKGKVLDLGCGQGRDAIALARLGFTVTGVDISKVGIEQMNLVANTERLPLNGIVADIYAFDNFSAFDIVLLDSMFHFLKNDREKETCLVKKIISQTQNGGVLVFCIQDTGDKVEILNQTIDFEQPMERLANKKIKYVFEDSENGHQSVSDYQMVVVRK